MRNIIEKTKLDCRGRELKAKRERIFARWRRPFTVGRNRTKWLLQQTIFVPLCNEDYSQAVFPAHEIIDESQN
jgi:hypothetical protein